VRPDTSTANPARWATNLPTNWGIGLVVAVFSLAMIAWAVYQSKRESAEMREIDQELTRGSSATGSKP